jgi:CPA1 family monovalent cation:H+ antiporter
MIIALLMSLMINGLGAFISDLEVATEQMLQRASFSETVLQGFLSFLLFAGALHIDLGELLKRKAVIGTMATVGVVVSTLLIGFGSWYSFSLLGITMPLAYCLLFGAIVSPTDPIAVIAIMRTIDTPKALEIKIAGESLFNDGVAIVLFIVLAQIASGAGDVGAIDVGILVLREAVGGALFGLATGWGTYFLLSKVDDYQLEILLTLALVTGTYAFANFVHISGPLAVVMAGLVIGSRGRRLAMTERTRVHLDTFWELLDEVLNAMLFVLIGLEVLLIEFDMRLLGATLIAITIALLSRFVSVAGVISIFKRIQRVRRFPPGTTRILTWGGLRGGISVALALSLPASEHRGSIVAVTYGVVVFSIIVQGLTIQKLVQGVQPELLTAVEEDGISRSQA